MGQVHPLDARQPRGQRVKTIKDLIGGVVEGIEQEERDDQIAVLEAAASNTPVVVRCSKAASCEVAFMCKFAKPHIAGDGYDHSPARCVDHRPHVPGGVVVFPEAVDPDVND